MARRKAPAFRLQDESGAWVTLDTLRGRRVVLFFFQKAGTPGCTVEACEFRDAMPRFASRHVTVFGVSPDTWRRHAKFRAAQRLPYALLADKEAVACKAYGVWHRKLFWGRHYMGVVRSTFVVGPDGRIEREWRDVHHVGHAAEVADWLEQRVARSTGRASPRVAPRVARPAEPGSAPRRAPRAGAGESE